MEIRIVIIILWLLVSIKGLYGQNYSRHDIDGIWKLEMNIHSTEAPEIFENEFYIFHNDSWLILCTHNQLCMSCVFSNEIDRSICVYKYGFVDDDTKIDTLKNEGKYWAYHIEGNDRYESDYFYVNPKEDLQFGYHECSYLETLPKKAQIVLYENSQKDHRNYAREFLDYDICGIKTEGCQLLDSLQQPVGVAIAKNDIVVVRETCGDFLKVEYEDVPEHFIYGYVKREDLVFVEE